MHLTVYEYSLVVRKISKIYVLFGFKAQEICIGPSCLPIKYILSCYTYSVLFAQICALNAILSFPIIHPSITYLSSIYLFTYLYNSSFGCQCSASACPPVSELRDLKMNQTGLLFCGAAWWPHMAT